MPLYILAQLMIDAMGLDEDHFVRQFHIASLGQSRQANTMQFVTILAVVCAMAVGNPAFAHTGEGAGGFLAGLSHPLFGLDHVIAMVAVGMWGAFLGPP